MASKPRIGVFICHCGENIAGTVDVTGLAERIIDYDDVTFSTDYEYMCSDPGQNKIKEAIEEEDLNGVIVAACSPSMHEETFRSAVEEAGLNRYRCEIANIREQCSWVHDGDGSKPTEKALRIIKGAVEKVKRNIPMEPVEREHSDKCLVIGGGVAGIQAALDVAEAGNEVVLVEKEPTIGGHMAQLSETFPTLDCSQCILTPKMVEVNQHPNIELMAYSEVKDVSGYIGNYSVQIENKPTYVDPDACNLCGDCEDVCPVNVQDEFNQGLTSRKAISIPFAQAIPSSYTLDEEACLGLNPLRCSKCADVCDADAVDFDQSSKFIEEEFGAIIVATGYDLYPKEKMGEYGYGQYEDVIDGLQFERLLSATGPTRGEVRRPSDGKVPKDVVFVQCSGSRDPENHNSYCSKICCMYTAKHAKLYKESVPDGNAYVFYIDIRAGGKDYEEFIQEVQEEDRVLYLKGKVSKLKKVDGKLRVWGMDEIAGERMEIDADLVVLAQSIIPSSEAKDTSRKLNLNLGQNGFYKEAHPKLRPVESLTGGVFFAGAGQGPKDIPDTVSQGSGAAAKAIEMLSKPTLTHDPQVVEVDEDLCSGCGLCISQCPYDALEVNSRGVAEVNEILCEGCGTCASGCPTNALSLKNLTDEQLTEMIHAQIGD
ncbi:CoB--CoM heterodisulfide reductase iron-sulfur subunit A family protein [Candidatus Bipolaricaulota bacterium]|nr:CoB--CoM heterodisulfide reductase iron-sulfur subunit A family protein [Candidatus Bipolaricaulota bacterium]